MRTIRCAAGILSIVTIILMYIWAFKQPGPKKLRGIVVWTILYIFGMFFFWLSILDFFYQLFTIGKVPNLLGSFVSMTVLFLGWYTYKIFRKLKSEEEEEEVLYGLIAPPLKVIKPEEKKRATKLIILTIAVIVLLLFSIYWNYRYYAEY